LVSSHEKAARDWRETAATRPIPHVLVGAYPRPAAERLTVR
jgi:hypothetical protein